MSDIMPAVRIGSSRRRSPDLVSETRVNIGSCGFPEEKNGEIRTTSIDAGDARIKQNL